MHRIIRIIFIFLIITIDVQSQQQRIGQWKSFTDMKSVRGIVQFGTSIWAVTSGGAFAFDTLSGQFSQFNNTDGLSSNDLHCIAAEPGKRIWIGEGNGFIDVYSQQTGMWTTIDANRSAYHTQIGVQDLFLQGDTMYIATMFGVMPFKIGKWEFGDTYATFGSLSSPIVTCIFASTDYIFVGTDKGLAIAPRTAPSLYAPDSWTTYSTIPGISSNHITALTVFKNTLIIATDKGIGYYYNGSFGVVTSFAGKSIKDILLDGERLLILRNEGSGFIVESLSSLTDVSQVVLSHSSVQASSLVPASPPWIGTVSKGLARQSVSGWDYSYPNGPNSNFFSSLAVDQKGVLWAASGSALESGFYRYDPSLSENTRWKNFPGAGYYRVSLGTPGSVWVSSWGNGVVEIISDTIYRTLDYYSTPRLPSAVSDDSDYVVTSDVAVDNEGKVWMVNLNKVDGRSLLRLNDDGSATYFDNQYPGFILDGWFHSLAIDRNGTKWLAGDLPWESKDVEGRLNGVYLFNENEYFTLFGVETTHGWGHLSPTEGLKSDVVLSLTIDLDGALWIGTNKGITIIFDPQYPEQITACFALQAYTRIVQCIAVDAVNNKWIGTNEGVFVVNPDGTQLLQAYDVTSTNGQLLDNNVRAIAIDQTRGIAFFGTEQGLSSLAIDAIQTSRSYSKLEVGPNPFTLPNNRPLTISNLMTNSTIKVITVSGSVVKQFEAQGGGRAFWDGRDKNGVFVPSGVYFIVAFAENGAQTVTGKVVVIRKY